MTDNPTISDLRDRLSDLIDAGFGDCPVELAPDATIQKIAEGHRAPHQTGPAVAIELAGFSDRYPVVICTSRPQSEMPDNPAYLVVKFRRLDS
jgi:hypothetical protein